MEPLIFTTNAAVKVWDLMREEENFNLKLRVFVTGGGCSGFQYGFTFAETIDTEDTVVTKKLDTTDDLHAGGLNVRAVQLLVDPVSFQYLVGSEIDYEEDVKGGQFIIRNPNAKTTCGCGSSFSTE